jgi:hypothetical protein
MNQDSTLNFLLNSEPKLKEFFDKNVKVNSNKTEIKYGSKADQYIDINFLINGETDYNIIDFKDKINCLFNSDSDITVLNTLINDIKQPERVNFGLNTPFIKVSHDSEPLKYAFRIIIFYDKGLEL